ncbi:hypothetical protein GQ44DRAFT_470055 [Phaeosphaeriaceae sp. PMI808]|nr:hypothetical protein GQ44DRAFT_470055 [Phaeosphaeriaceae sp. PMI808]
MAVGNTIGRDEIEKFEGHMLVRRFTDELCGQTTLERATISVQQEQDAIAEEHIRTRMRALFEDEDRSDAVFHAVETARLTLEKTCKKFEVVEQPSGLGKLMGRKSARTAANEVMRGKAALGFVQLNDYINGLESTWKDNQGKFSKRFRSICGGLDAHKKAFAIFPSQNNYAAALCGSLQLIVSAAVNHDEIADTISETVANITQKAARAANTLLLVRTRAIRELFSELYAHVFEFYSDAIEWYMQSKASRFWNSFNAKVKERHEQAAARIENILVEMYREMNMAHFAEYKIRLTEKERQADIARQRQQYPDRYELLSAGRNAQEMLLGLHKSRCIEAWTDGRTLEGQETLQSPISSKRISAITNLLNRAAIRSFATPLETFVVGSEGQDLFNDGKLWLPDITISMKLHNFIGNDASSPTLWISSPDAGPEEFPSSRAAAVNLFLAAWQAEMPLVSHFCVRLRYATLAKNRKVEEVGLIGLVYSLIRQLLQFDFEDDEFFIPKKDIEALDGSDHSWRQALNLLSTLLKTTPHLSLCLIHGLNDLAFSSSGAEWCGAFLAILFAHQQSSPNTFRILLTTTGQSRALQEYVDVSDRMFVENGAREVMRGGRWIGATERA